MGIIIKFIISRFFFFKKNATHHFFLRENRGKQQGEVSGMSVNPWRTNTIERLHLA